jgi:hypothetical protein
MLVSLDNLASRYHLLPSECLQRADSFDMYVLNVSAKWEEKKREEINMGQQGAKAKPKTPKLTQEQMISMINVVKERHK